MTASPSLLHRIGRPLLLGGIVTAGLLAGMPEAASAATSSAQLSAFSVSPGSVVGGSTATATVALAAPAPPDGALVTISDDSAATSVPSSVTVPAGLSSYSFSIPSVPVSTRNLATITARTDANTVTTQLEVRAPAPLTLSYDTSVVLGSQPQYATVTLDGAAPSGGVRVQLVDDSWAAYPPTAVTVLAGQTSARFAINTAAVSAQTTVTLTASANYVARQASFGIRPARVRSITLNPSTVPGGVSSEGTVNLEGPAGPTPTSVAISESSAAISAPTSASVPAGQTSGKFAIPTLPVTANTTAYIWASAHGGSSYDLLTVRLPRLVSVSVNPSSVDGGQTATGMVTLDGPAAAPMSVSIADNSVKVSTDASATVPVGASTGQFGVRTSVTSFDTQATITATMAGIQRSTTMWVLAAPTEPDCGTYAC